MCLGLICTGEQRIKMLNDLQICTDFYADCGKSVNLNTNKI